MDFTIHNGPGNFSDTNGLYLMVGSARISNQKFYFGLQTNVRDPALRRGRGKGLIFSRWGERDLSFARVAGRQEGWSQSSGHEGDFIGVRRSYDWGAGDYRIRIASDGLDEDGEWYGVWITDLTKNVETWGGSLKFPLVNGTTAIEAASYTTIEIYGPSIRPIDIPGWHVSFGRPSGDGVKASSARPGYSAFNGGIQNSGLRHDRAAEVVHLQVGGTTERAGPTDTIQFRTVNSSPRVEGMEVVSRPASGYTYRAGETLEIAMKFNQPVEVEGDIHLSLQVGSDDPEIGGRAASYLRGSGSDRLVFGYTVTPDDLDTNGISVLGSWVDPERTLRGIEGNGNIRVAGTRFRVAAVFNSLYNLGGHQLDGRVRVDGMEVVSRPASGDTYRTGETLEIVIKFDNPVEVEGDIHLSLQVGSDDPEIGWRAASYLRGSGSHRLVFGYTVLPDDLDTNGISVVGSRVDNDGTLRGIDGNGSIRVASTRFRVAPVFNSLYNLGGHKLDGRVRVDGMEVISRPSSGDTYRAGETFEIAMKFNQPVEVEGDIHLSMRVGSDDPDIGWRAASYLRGSGSDRLVFGYTVIPDDLDTDGISVLGSWVDSAGTLRGIGGSGKITVAGTDFRITPEFNGVTNLGGHKVNGNPDSTS